MFFCLAASFAATLQGCAAAPTPAAKAGGGSGKPAAIPEDPAARLADLEALASGLVSKHPAFRERGSEAARARFEARAEELRSRLSGLSPEAAEVELARLVASLGDGHTGLVLPSYSLLPMDLYQFEEGFYVTSVAKEYPDLLGKRIVALGGVAIERIAAELAALVPHDNDSGLADQLRYRLVMPDLLAGLGLLPAGLERIEVEAADGAGRSQRTEVSVWTFEEEEPEFVSIDEGLELPAYRSRGKENYWFALAPGTRTLHLAYNRCRENPERPAREFAKELDRFLASGAADRVLVDLRNNGGGSQPVFWPILRVLASRAKGPGGLPVYVAIGRRTFSSAVLNAVELARGGRGLLALLAPSAGARFVGESSGGKPNHYGDVTSFRLPNSGLRVQHSTKHFKPWPNEAVALEPEIAIPLRWSDYRAGRDPVLEAVAGLQLPARRAR